MTEIEERIEKALDTRDARRSRRFVTNITVRFTSLRSSDSKEGKIVNMSVHGGLLQIEKTTSLQPREQLRLKVPVGPFLPKEHGEFLSLSCRVERVFLGGGQAAISWSHLSEAQFFVLTTFVLQLAGQQAAKSYIVPLPGHG